MALIITNTHNMINNLRKLCPICVMRYSLIESIVNNLWSGPSKIVLDNANQHFEYGFPQMESQAQR